MKVSKGGQPIIQPARLSSYHLVPSRPVRERANEELRVTCEKEKKKERKMERVERGEFDSRVLSRSSISFFPRRCILGEKAPVS